ncbi:MAG: transporter substrate-binding domain-containing protein [Candidatus Portiera sp.]|nr:transporter substrate-binding domain-containing protein [Portiera sp.]
MNKIFTIAIVISALLIASCAQEADNDVKSIKIGVEGAYPPFSKTESDGSLSGFDIDMSFALCEEMGYECTLVKQDWDGMIPALLSQKYDAIIASMSITEERKKKVAFTDKYYQMPVNFVAPEGSNLDISESGLAGKKIGVQRATTFDTYVTDNFGDVAEIVRYTSQEEVFLDLQAGRVDATLAERANIEEGFLNTPAGSGFATVGPDITDPEWFGDGIGIALRKGDDELREEFNDAIEELIEDGTYEKINNKYFSYDIFGN